MNQDKRDGWIARVPRSQGGLGRRLVTVALAAIAISSMAGGVAASDATRDCRAPRLAVNVQDFGSPFASSMSDAVGDDRGRSRRGTNAEDFGAPAPGG
jgi:ABC-type sugar transport system substrate-binding protein